MGEPGSQTPSQGFMMGAGHQRAVLSGGKWYYVRDKASVKDVSGSREGEEEYSGFFSACCHLLCLPTGQIVLEARGQGCLEIAVDYDTEQHRVSLGNGPVSI